jgi:hypothetical protein
MNNIQPMVGIGVGLNSKWNIAGSLILKNMNST